MINKPPRKQNREYWHFHSAITYLCDISPQVELDDMPGVRESVLRREDAEDVLLMLAEALAERLEPSALYDVLAHAWYKRRSGKGQAYNMFDDNEEDRDDDQEV